MVVNVTPEMIQKFEADRKAKLAAIQAEQAKIDAERQKKQDYYFNLHQRRDGVHVAGVDHDRCEGCGEKILKNSRIYSKSVVTGYGWPEGEHRITYYWHEGCKKEAKA